MYASDDPGAADGKLGLLSADPRQRIARDQDVERQDCLEIEPAANVVRMHPCRQKHPAVLRYNRHPKIQVLVVEPGNQFAMGFGFRHLKARKVRSQPCVYAEETAPILGSL